MEPWQAVVLGVVEGITECLPVSSTAHLLITQRLMGIASSEASGSYAIVIQAGAIVAVLFLYRHRVLPLIVFGWWRLIAATVLVAMMIAGAI